MPLGRWSNFHRVHVSSSPPATLGTRNSSQTLSQISGQSFSRSLWVMDVRAENSVLLRRRWLGKTFWPLGIRVRNVHTKFGSNNLWLCSFSSLIHSFSRTWRCGITLLHSVSISSSVSQEYCATLLNLGEKKHLGSSEEEVSHANQCLFSGALHGSVAGTLHLLLKPFILVNQRSESFRKFLGKLRMILCYWRLWWFPIIGNMWAASEIGCQNSCQSFFRRVSRFWGDSDFWM